MDLVELQRNWNEFGESDPLWSVLTDPRRKDNKWDPVEFFRTGEQEIDSMLAGLDAMGIKFPRCRALDFGCAVGRLTQALCRHFEHCDGVDIAPSMIELARKYNKHPDRCTFHLNEADDLAIFQDNSYDFIYSRFTLQHMLPRYSKKYIKEFVRVLRPEGVLVFQLPAELLGVRPESRQFSGALPESGFRASLAIHDPPTEFEAGAPSMLPVRVTNISPISWPGSKVQDGRGIIVLGNHWLAADGAVLVVDDGREVIPHDLRPSEATDVLLHITVPPTPGTYILELDLVQEGISWFQQKGSETLRMTVHVRPRTNPRPPKTMPVMEMYGVPKHEVLEVLEAAGGTAIRVLDDESAGGWVGHLYVVTKASECSAPYSVSTSEGESRMSIARALTAQESAKAPVSQRLPTDIAARDGSAISQLAKIVVENATLQASATTAIASRVLALEHRQQHAMASAFAGAGNGESRLTNALAENVGLLARVSDAMVSRLLAIENLVRETNSLVSGLSAGIPPGGRFAVYQGNNTALTRILNRFYMYVDTTDLSLAPHIIMQGQWEPWITNLFTQLIRPGMTVVDIGANFGYYTILAAAAVGALGKVYAFEADPRNYEILRLNTQVNGLLDIVQTHHCAVLDQKTRMQLRKNPTLLGCHSLFAGDQDNPRNVWVEAVPLDDIIQGSVDLMKIDAEGSEPFIFEGMRKVLERSPEVTIVMEFNVPVLKLAGVEPARFLRTIQDHKFRVSIITREGHLEPLNEQKLLDGPLYDLLLTRK